MSTREAPATTLARAVAQAKTVLALGDDRVFSGHKRWLSAQNYRTMIGELEPEEEGYCLLWLNASTAFNDDGEIEIEGELAFPLSGDTGELGDLWDVIEDIRQALEDQGAYTSGYEMPPASCSIRLRELDLTMPPAALFDVRVTCPAIRQGTETVWTGLLNEVNAQIYNAAADAILVGAT